MRKTIFENRKTKLYLGWGRKNISTGLEGFWLEEVYSWKWTHNSPKWGNKHYRIILFCANCFHVWNLFLKIYTYKPMQIAPKTTITNTFQWINAVTNSAMNKKEEEEEEACPQIAFFWKGVSPGMKCNREHCLFFFQWACGGQGSIGRRRSSSNPLDEVTNMKHTMSLDSIKNHILGNIIHHEIPF